MKKFFSITASHYKFEVYDITALLTILNVLFILLGFAWAPLFGIVNCAIFIALNVKTKAHINSWITQLSLIVLNVYFLNL